MPMTIDEAIQALTEIKAEIGGERYVEVSGDSGYLRDMETLTPVPRVDPWICSACPGEPTFATKEQAQAHEKVMHHGQHYSFQEDYGPPEPPAAGLIMGDYASDAEEAYERMMDR